MFQLKRVYETPSPKDGVRALVDRLWPRGLTKEDAALDQWLKDVAPSTELRRWFGHDPDKWQEFQVRYRAELRDQGESLASLKRSGQKQTVTLVYAARDEEHNAAQVLKQVLEGRRRSPAPKPRTPRNRTGARSLA